MRFLVDECTGPAVARWLHSQQYDVFSVYEEARGMTDEEIIRMASAENWILITNDKDFGEKIYREQHPHCGVVFLRLSDERATNKIATLQKLLHGYGGELAGQYVVVTETKVRFARR